MSIIVKYYPRLPGQKRRVKVRYIVDDNGKKQGLFQSFHRNGSDSVTCWYKNDKKHGRYTSHHPNGHVATECSYDEDRLEGAYRTYYPTGLPSFIGRFHKNLGEGKQTWFHPDGGISCYEFQHQGHREGQVVSFPCADYAGSYGDRADARLLMRQSRSEKSDISRRTALKMDKENFRT